ncbi:hypothetical protein HUT10_45140 [Amycolatopsis sp. Hca4]|nr:hypothetical protein HUT10_45140 [Amycolatopsis sp. Hca4]
MGERQDRLALEVVDDVPAGVQQPGDPDGRPRVEPPEGEAGQHRAERELPRAERSAGEVGGAGAAHEHGVEPAAVLLRDQRVEQDEGEADEDRRQDLDHGS